MLPAAWWIGSLAWSSPVPAEDAGAPRVIDVISLNAWGLPAPIAADRRGRLPRIADWVRGEGADVVGFQEVWRGALSLFQLDGLSYAADGADSGLALYSPHPVTDLTVRAFSVARGVDRLKGKGVLHARVDVGGAPIDVFVTHLQAGSGFRNAIVRESQAAELLALVAAAPGPAIVLGDFNLYAGDPIDEDTWARLQAGGLVDSTHTIGVLDNTWVGRDGESALDARHRFDHVYVRDAVPTAAEVVRYDDDPATANPAFLSDHLPVRVTVELP